MITPIPDFHHSNLPQIIHASFVSLDGMSVRSLPICRDELQPYFP